MKPPQEFSEETRLRDALADIIKDESVDAWLQRPNKQFKGATPLELMECGDANRIWQMIWQLREGNSG